MSSSFLEITRASFERQYEVGILYDVYLHNYEAMRQAYSEASPQSELGRLFEGSRPLDRAEFAEAVNDIGVVASGNGLLIGYLNRVFVLGQGTADYLEAREGSEILAVSMLGIGVTGLNAARYFDMPSRLRGHTLVHEFVHVSLGLDGTAECLTDRIASSITGVTHFIDRACR